MDAHTPGPWVAICDERRINRWRVEDATGECWIADAQQVVRGPFPEVAANARLIAAAPEMREALKVAQQALIEVAHAQQAGPGWYTRGEDGLQAQVRMWVRRGSEAVSTALAKTEAT